MVVSHLSMRWILDLANAQKVDVQDGHGMKEIQYGSR